MQCQWARVQLVKSGSVGVGPVDRAKICTASCACKFFGLKDNCYDIMHILIFLFLFVTCLNHALYDVPDTLTAWIKLENIKWKWRQCAHEIGSRRSEHIFQSLSPFVVISNNINKYYSFNFPFSSNYMTVWYRKKTMPYSCAYHANKFPDIVTFIRAITDVIIVVYQCFIYLNIKRINILKVPLTWISNFVTEQGVLFEFISLCDKRHFFLVSLPSTKFFPVYSNGWLDHWLACPLCMFREFSWLIELRMNPVPMFLSLLVSSLVWMYYHC